MDGTLYTPENKYEECMVGKKNLIQELQKEKNGKVKGESLKGKNANLNTNKQPKWAK